MSEKIENNGILAQDLLDILACPLCKTDIYLVKYRENNHGLQCSQCNRIYPIKEGIPVMLIDEAIIEE